MSLKQKRQKFRKKILTLLNILCTYIFFHDIVATHRNNMRSHIVHHFCGTHNLKLWPPHIDTACLVDIGKQTHIDTFCGTYNFKLWPPHIETTCVSHIENQSLYVATHPILVLYECYYMWPHIVPFSANYLPPCLPLLLL